MELLSYEEIEIIIKQVGYTKPLNWTITEFSNTLVGYLGDHLTLTVDVLADKMKKKQFKCFIKCMPRFDEWKAKYLRESSFFKKEYVMLNDLFRKFEKGTSKWRPACLFARENLFVFEDVTDLGYKMPDHRYTLTLNELKACVITMAKFHADSYIYEEKRSKDLERPYRIWEEYSEYLQEPENGMNWRNAGRNAVIEYLKVYSKHRLNPKFIEKVESVVTKLYDKAFILMKPSSKYRNAVVHRDLWTNNIFLKEESDGTIDAIFVDFQTVVYCSPMLDLSSLIYFSTYRDVRESSVAVLMDIYYESLSKELAASNINSNLIIDRGTLQECYEDSLPFALVQASLIIPITAMEVEVREKIFNNPDSSYRINEVSRSLEIIESAMQDVRYRNRVSDIFEEIVDRYIL